MAGEGSRSGSAADSYIGSVISLTSKSEMRYEGVLYNINPEESSIGLRNVRSFGTEGRKKDGSQVPPSERVYEYILFRGSDIKDLQVKSSPAAQNSSPVNNDPAIIQHPHSAATSRSILSSTTADTSLQTSQLGMHGSNVQNNAPLYQPGASMGSWGSSQASDNGNGNGMPTYWQGYYPPPNGLHSHQYQQPLLRPPGLSTPSLLQQQMPPIQQQLPPHLQPHMPSLQQQMPSLYQQMPSSFQQPLQYHNFSAPLLIGTSSLQAPPSLFPSGTGPGISTSISSSSATFPSSLPTALPTVPVTNLALDAASNSIPIKTPIAPPLIADKTQVTSLSPASSLLSSGLGENGLLLPLPSRPVTTTTPPSHQSEIAPSNVEAANSTPKSAQAPAPALVTPGHLLKSSPVSLASSSKTVHKDAEVVILSSSSAPEPPASDDLNVKLTNQSLPASSRSSYKPNGTHGHSYHGYRGRGRGRGRMSSLPLTTFNEEFDFTAMNEKFNKDEIWGHLGKSSKPHHQEDGKHVDEKLPQNEESGMPKIDIKPVYNKDDFFDSLSSTEHDQDSNQGRHRFSEQRKIDTETFGEFSRYRGGRGIYGPGCGGGGRYRGSFYYGRDSGRGGYGYGRSRGRRGSN